METRFLLLQNLVGGMGVLIGTEPARRLRFILTEYCNYG